MIKVIITKQGELIKSLKVSGHANYNDYGKDIVCAGVSSIVIGGLNALTSLEQKDKIKALVNEGHVEIEVLDLTNQNLQYILKVILIQLRSIEESYPSFVKIK